MPTATLGRRTGELKVALSHCTDDPAFAPEPCSSRYWESLRDRMQQSIRSALRLLGERRTDLDADTTAGRSGAVAERHQSGVVNRTAKAIASWWHLLFDGVFSEARTPRVQVPSGRGALERSTPLCPRAEPLPPAWRS